MSRHYVRARYDYLQPMPYAIYFANATNVKNVEGSWRSLAHKISSLQYPETCICCIRRGRRAQNRNFYISIFRLSKHIISIQRYILLWRDIYVIFFCFRIVFPCTGASSIVISFRPFFFLCSAQAKRSEKDCRSFSWQFQSWNLKNTAPRDNARSSGSSLPLKRGQHAGASGCTQRVPRVSHK